MVPGSPGAFASFEIVPLLEDGSVYPGPSLPSSIEGVLKPGWLTPEPEVAATLLTQGFVVIPDGYRQFQHAYASYLYEGQVFFVTTDGGYHFLHLAFSKLLRDIEQNRLLPILEELVLGLVEAARKQTTELEGTDLAEAARRAQQIYEAVATLLELEVGPTGPLAQQEVELALEASQLTASPTTSVGECMPLASLRNCVDYSLFKPRGHYTRNEDLERYFRAMSMLGQASFFIHDAGSLRIGMLAARPLMRDADLAEAWRLVYEPTAFMVGVADDYTPSELAKAAGEVVPGWLDDPAVFADAGAVDDLAQELAAQRPVGIDPENASARIMGVRFVLDSYVYDQLRFPHVGDPPYGRVYATTLDLAAVFGSDLAYRELQASGETEYTNYETQFAAMQDLVNGRPDDDWAGTVYDAWLKQNKGDTSALKLGNLGGGSDVAGFSHHLGIPSGGIGFSSPGGVYHSMYDSYHWMTTFGDSGYRAHRAAAQLVGVMLARLANAEILPLDYVGFGTEMAGLVAQLDSGIARRGWAVGTRGLKDALVRFTESARRFAQARDSALDQGADTGRYARANAALMQVERRLTRPQGLVSRPWYRSLQFASDLDNGYATMAFPSVNEAIRYADRATAGRELQDLTARVDHARAALEQATAALR